MTRHAHRPGASRIAVIGAGISGLTAAHALAPEHDVTVFEAEPRLGGHSSTVIVDSDVGEQPVDTGFIVFNDRNYPNFSRLLETIGAEHVRSNMSFSVSDEAGRFEYAGSSPNALFATRSNIFRPSFYGMIGDLLRFNRAAKDALASGRGEQSGSLRGFLEAGGYSRAFIEQLIVPQVAAVWSADPRQLDEFPVGIVFEFFNNHGILELRDRPVWRTIKGGSADYVERLRAAIKGDVYAGVPVEAVRRGEHGVAVKLADGAEVVFDEVVFATHSDQALRLLADPTGDEREVLGAIPYSDNDVVLHTDRSLLPRRRAARASWNYHLLDEPRDRSTVTYWMNNLQPIAGRTDYMVTLNLTDRIDPGQIIKQQNFSHPVFTREGLAAQRRHHEISGVGRTHFCGAYWRWGFHEDGVWSALRVADAIYGRTRDGADQPEHAARLKAVSTLIGRSAVYSGDVAHARLGPDGRRFRYPVRMFLFDLEELENPAAAAGAFGGSRLFAVGCRAVASFRREDFLGEPQRALSESARDVVEAATGERPAGVVKLLANARSFGYQFNPIAVYYLHRGDGSLSHVIADVTNMPWRERCQYVFAAGADGVVDGTAVKRMHVSPFMGMDYVYRLRTAAPNGALSLSVSNSRDGETEFTAALDLVNAGSSAAALRRSVARFPAMALLVTGRIFAQAVRMRLAGFSWHARPEGADRVESERGKEAGHHAAIS